MNNVDLLYQLLSQFHWTKDRTHIRNAELWFRSVDDMEKKNFQNSVIVPTDSTKSDYAELVSKALTILQRMYGTRFDTACSFAQAELLMALDPIELREDTGSTNGMIGWDLGTHLIATMDGMLKASAKASVTKERRYGKSQSTVSDSVIKGTYMGQTKIGSYIVTAYIPSSHSFAITESKDEKNIHKSVSGREVTISMKKALQAFDEATKEVLKSSSETSYEVFDETVEDGVSYELLSAISNLSSDNETQVTISFAQEHGNAPEQYEIVIAPNVQPVVEKAREYLKLPEKASECHILGEIVRLNHDSSKRNYEISMKTIGKDMPQTVKVYLSEEDYAKAVETHGQGKLFALTGMIHRRKRGATFVDGVSFSQNTGISISSDAPDTEALTKGMRKSLRSGQGLLNWTIDGSEL